MTKKKIPVRLSLHDPGENDLKGKSPAELKDKV